MSLWSRIRSRLARHRRTSEVSSGRAEDTGGVDDPSTPDTNSTTGTTPNATFVGRAAGEDPGYLETGAEKRAAADEDRRDEGRG